MEIYRYRPYNEYDKIGLENSEIYFPELSQLNDPMEGYTDIYFQGDKVIWTNLLRNYLRSLFEAFLFAQISKPLPEAPEDLFIPLIPFHLWPDEQFEKIQSLDWFNTLPQQFINQKAVKSLIENIVNKHISREQLLCSLKVIHPIALQITTQYMIDSQLLRTSNCPVPQVSQDEINWDIFFSINNNEKIGHISSLLNQISDSLPLLTDQIDVRSQHLCLDFPNLFIQKLENVMYPQFYAACFSENPKNSSMWGNYANSHKGICLKFNIDDGLPLYAPCGIGTHGKIYEWLPHKFYKINYSNKLISLNFFENLGNISLGILNKLWLRDNETNEVTTIKLIDDETRNTYWQNIYDALTQKTKDWAYEKEHRLLLNNMFGSFYDKKDRTLKYQFNNLEGIIFGMKCPDKNKREIIKIIINKCQKEGRDNFKFYQAYYNQKTCSIDLREDPICRFLKLNKK